MPPEAMASSEVVTTSSASGCRRCGVGPQHELEAHRLGELRCADRTRPTRHRTARPAAASALVERVDAGQVVAAARVVGAVRPIASVSSPVCSAGRRGGCARRRRPRSSSWQEVRLGEVRAAVERLAVGRAGTRSSASRRGRSSPGRHPCRRRRRRAAPRGRP